MNNINTKILVTGGLGYIGSNMAFTLLKLGYHVVILDNLSRGCLMRKSVLESHFASNLEIILGDILDKELLREVFKTNNFFAVAHFAALKSISESFEWPDYYHRNNYEGTKVILEAMLKANVKKLIFSSSATVYASKSKMPLVESAAIGPASNPYGETKIKSEALLGKACEIDKELSVVSLRYFNPAGAGNNCLIGESLDLKQSNLFPKITRVCLGLEPVFHLYGNDFNTKDGSGIRDYIHIDDLVEGHIMALRTIKHLQGCEYVNLGTGNGLSVLEVVKMFEKVAKVEIKIEASNRRQGDLGVCYADASYAKKLLGWRARKSLRQMVEDHWRWIIHTQSQ